ncbi:MAG: HipA domain-containing protein [Vicinamibacterales bacterium]
MDLGQRIVIAEVRMWGRTIGAVSIEDDQDYATFQFTPEFAGSNIQVSPVTMPLRPEGYEFPELPRATFHGLPGMLADSLPDRFGNALIDAWLATEGRKPESFSAIDRLCYTGTRGMGALEYAPALGPKPKRLTKVNVDALVRLASEVLTHRQNLEGHFADQSRGKALADILQVGTSAGGARAKAVIAWNRKTNEVRSGQLPAGPGFTYWLLKFDGVAGNKDKELEDPQGYGAIEYAYALMAQAAGVAMAECQLLEESGRRHFMTRRFDRSDDGSKLHMQSLGALAHLDYNQAGAYAYEQAFLTIRQLELPMAAIEEQFRRMLFNVVARNQDDHVKNIAFLMNKEGDWSLSPAFDMTYSYNPSGSWTATHQMTINGKRDGFDLADIRAAAKSAGLKQGRANALLEEVATHVARWPEFAARAGLSDDMTERIRTAHRLHLRS